MSFLLDALGKADDDRQRAQIPELATNQQRTPDSFLRRSLRIAIILSALLLAFGLGYFLRPFIDGDLSLTIIKAQETAAVQDADAKQAENNLANMPEKKSENKPENKLEALDLSVISYSDKPATRFAMINGFVMHEGDVLAGGERIVRIEFDKVVLEKNQQETSLNLSLGLNLIKD